MISSPTTTGPTFLDQSTTSPFARERGTSPGVAQPASSTDFGGFEFDWPGRERWAVLVDSCREQLFAMEEWWMVRRTGSGELGISPPPALLRMDDDPGTPTWPRQTVERYDGVGFSTSWTLLAG